MSKKPKFQLYLSLSPQDMEKRFTEEDSIKTYPSDFTLEEAFGVSPDALKEKLKFLPAREAEIVHLYYFMKKRQEAIGLLLDITQADVSYRLRRAIKRLKFMFTCPDVPEEKMREDLKFLLQDDMLVEIMVGIYETSSQSEVSKRVGMYQGRVRYRFVKSLEKLKEYENDEKYGVYYKIFQSFKGNFNIYRELEIQGRWKSKFSDVVLGT